MTSRSFRFPSFRRGKTKKSLWAIANHRFLAWQAITEYVSMAMDRMKDDFVVTVTVNDAGVRVDKCVHCGKDKR